MSFFKNRGLEGKTGPVWGLVSVRGRGYKERMQENKYGGNVMYLCMKMKK
jgi:hypothetical protein